PPKLRPIRESLHIQALAVGSLDGGIRCPDCTNFCVSQSHLGASPLALTPQTTIMPPAMPPFEADYGGVTAIIQQQCGTINGRFCRVVDPSGDAGGLVDGVEKRSRTSTLFRAPPREDGASTNSAIWARGRRRPLAIRIVSCQQRRSGRAACGRGRA